jgi:hypothetical protein
MSEAAEDQGWRKEEPRDEDETARLLRCSPRFCALCAKWTDHHTDRHQPEDGELADVSVMVAACRETLAANRTTAS